MGRLGPVPLGAVGLSGVLFNFSNFLFNFLMFVTTPAVARAVAQNDLDEVRAACLHAPACTVFVLRLCWVRVGLAGGVAPAAALPSAQLAWLSIPQRPKLTARAAVPLCTCAGVARHGQRLVGGAGVRRGDDAVHVERSAGAAVRCAPRRCPFALRSRGLQLGCLALQSRAISVRLAAPHDR